MALEIEEVAEVVVEVSFEEVLSEIVNVLRHWDSKSMVLADICCN